MHRDFKPDTVLVDGTGGVRVTDFGLAHALGPSSRGDGDSGERSWSSSDDTRGTPAPALETRLTRTGGLLGTPKYMAPEQHRAQPTTPQTDQFAFCVVVYEAVYGEHPFAGETAAELAVAVTENRRRPAKPVANAPATLRPALDRGLSTDPADRFDSMADLLAALSPDSTRRRRAIWIGAVAAVLMAAAVAFFVLRARGATQAAGPDCFAQRDRIERAWNERSRDALSQKFSTAGLPGAAETGASFISRIDDYADRWSAMRVETCEATHVRGEQSESLLDLRMRCLDRRLDAVQALVDIYSEEMTSTKLSRAIRRWASSRATSTRAPTPTISRP